MALIYKGKFPEHINGIPARDLSDEEIVKIGQRPEYGLSLAEMEGLLMKRGLYASAPKESKKAAKSIARDVDILETKEEEN